MSVILNILKCQWFPVVTVTPFCFIIRSSYKKCNLNTDTKQKHGPTKKELSLIIKNQGTNATLLTDCVSRQFCPNWCLSAVKYFKFSKEAIYLSITSLLFNECLLHIRHLAKHLPWIMQANLSVWICTRTHTCTLVYTQTHTLRWVLTVSPFHG